MVSLVNSFKIKKKKKKKHGLFSNFSQKIYKERTFSNSFSEAIIVPISKSEKDTARRETWRLIPLINIDSEILKKIPAKQIQQHIKIMTHYDQLGFISEM